jgi:hypothetical protein
MELALGGPVHAEDMRKEVERTKNVAIAYGGEAQRLSTEIR